jgi:hypothetical protein
MKRSTVSHHNDTPRRRLNGHAGANGSERLCVAAAAPNGHTELGKAGSDDASEFSAANAASLASMAGADRKATADLAESAAEGRLRAAGTASGSAGPVTKQSEGDGASQRILRAKGDEKAGVGAKGKKENPFADVPPGRKPLPRNGEAFVKAVHRRVDLLELEVKLLRHKDEKVVQRELAYLRELRYGKRAPTETDNESSRPIIYDAPRPPRDLP